EGSHHAGDRAAVGRVDGEGVAGVVAGQRVAAAVAIDAGLAAAAGEGEGVGAGAADQALDVAEGGDHAGDRAAVGRVDAEGVAGVVAGQRVAAATAVDAGLAARAGEGEAVGAGAA